MHLTILVPFRDEPQQNRARQLAYFEQHMPQLIQQALDTVMGTSAFASAAATSSVEDKDKAAAAAATPPIASVRVCIGHHAHDGHMFARGRTLNALFLLAEARGWTTPAHRLILHDVDLIPDWARAQGYALPFATDERARALARAGGEYEACANYVGGVLALASADFAAVNGFPNEMEGWGGEDDALYDRLCAHWRRTTAPPDDSPPGDIAARPPITSFAAGSMHNLELDDAFKGIRRARDIAECCAPRDARRRARARWSQNAGTPQENGLRQLVFLAREIPSPGRLAHAKTITASSHPTVTHFYIDSPVILEPGWCVRWSRKHRIPYFYHAETDSSKFST